MSGWIEAGGNLIPIFELLSLQYTKKETKCNQ